MKKLSFALIVLFLLGLPAWGVPIITIGASETSPGSQLISDGAYGTAQVLAVGFMLDRTYTNVDISVNLGPDGYGFGGGNLVAFLTNAIGDGVNVVTSANEIIPGAVALTAPDEPTWVSVFSGITLNPSGLAAYPVYLVIGPGSSTTSSNEGGWSTSSEPSAGLSPGVSYLGQYWTNSLATYLPNSAFAAGTNTDLGGALMIGPTPEPATFLLIGGALIGLAALRRRIA